MTNNPTTQLAELPLSAVMPDPTQARKHFDDQSLENLADSIRLDGVLQPIVVHPADHDGIHKIIAGERRWRAANRAGLQTIPALIRAVDDPAKLLSLQIVENLQRDPLNLADTMAGVAKLVAMPDENGKPLGVRGAARKLSKSPTWISRRANLDRMSQLARAAVLDGEISDPDLADAFDKLARIDGRRAREIYDWHVSGSWALTRDAVREELQRATDRAGDNTNDNSQPTANTAPTEPPAAAPTEQAPLPPKPQAAEPASTQPPASTTPEPKPPTTGDCLMRATINELQYKANKALGDGLQVRPDNEHMPITTDPKHLADAMASIGIAGEPQAVGALLQMLAGPNRQMTIRVQVDGASMMTAIKKLQKTQTRRTGKASVSDALQSAVGRWLDECTRKDKTGGILASQARELFNAWHAANGGTPVSINKLGVAMTNAGVTKARSNDNRVMYVGITHTGAD